jgi:glycosyltransferase involved in cell wall biosynthesis
VLRAFFKKTPMKSARKPHLLFFLPSLTIGGAERHTIDLCQRLRQHGYRAQILVHGRVRSPTLLQAPACDDVIILDLKGMSDPMGWVKAWWTIRRISPDIIIGINQTTLIISVILRLLLATRARIACIFHTTDLQAFEKYQETILLKIGRMIDLMVYVGSNQKKVWDQRGLRSRRTAIIRNGLELTRFQVPGSERQAVRDRYELMDEDFVLGIVAAFRIEKNHVELVSALATARAAGTNLKVMCIGDGKTRQAVVEQAERLGVLDRLIFVGEQSDVRPFIAACDAGVLCSTIETFPISAIEFLALGRPMIGADVGGIAEIVNDQVNGLLYPAGDIEAFARAIASMADPVRRAEMTAAARPSVAELSADHMVEKYEAAFDALVHPA